MRAIRTIGYEGVNIDAFLETLVNAKIDIVLDIRDVPVSRKKGFSKNILAGLLAEYGIKYRHEKSLGSPKKLRDDLRASGDYRTFFRLYERHLDGQSALIEKLADEVTGSIALLCYEQNPAECHRRSVADALGAQTGITPRHLVVQPEGSVKFVAA